MPTWNDYFFTCMMVVLLPVGITHQFKYRTESLALLGFLTIIISWLSFSLDRVIIDCMNKTIHRHNNNPVVNWYRKTFKIPVEINFSDVKEIVLYDTGPKTQLHIVKAITTDDVNVKIGSFNKNANAEIFERFLKSLLSIHDKKFTGWDFLHV